MFKSLVLCLSVFVSLLFSQVTFAVAPTAKAVVIQLHSTSTIPYNSWTEVLAATGGVVKEIVVNSTATNDIEFGVGASGSEVVHFDAAAGVLSSTDFTNAPPSAWSGANQYFPVRIAANRRVAVRCLRSTCSVGRVLLNFLYQ